MPFAVLITGGCDHEGSDLSRLRWAVVVRQVWLLPLVPPRLRTAGGSCRKAAGRQSYTALRGG